jgi:ubiquinone/menaquinone biosynthesis C-methylase UbiE
MNIEAFTDTKIGQIFMRIMAAIMESRLRYRFFGPMKIIQGAEIRQGQKVLEVGCGTGFFTIPAARLIGDRGCLVAMDMLPISVETVDRKVQTSNLKNVRVVKGDALNTQLEAESMDAIMIFGVIPAPMIPMDKLLIEMYRILKPGGTMAVWPPIPGFLPKSILQSELFTYIRKRNGVHNFRRL